MKFYKVFLVVCLALLVSCKNNKPNTIDIKDLTTINIENINSKSALPFENYKIIKLEANKKCLIGMVSKILYNKNCYYILDKRIRKGVFVFDDSGKFLFSVRRLGRGPGEYSDCNDFDVDKEGNIYVMDMNNRKIIKYGSKGEFKEEYPYGFLSFQFCQIVKDTFAFYQLSAPNRLEELRYNVVYWTSDQRLIKRYFPYSLSNGEKLSIMPYNFFKSTNSMLLSYNFCDTIFSITDQGVKAKYRLNFGKYAIPYNKLQQLLDSKKAEKYLENNDIAWKYASFYENSDFFVSTFSFRNNLGIVQYVKTTKTVNVYTIPSINFYYIVSMLPVGTVDENVFFGYVSPNMLLRLKKENSNSGIKLFDELTGLVNEKDELTNPYIITYKLVK